MTRGGAVQASADKRPVSVVDRLRVENLTPGGFLSLGGVGEYRGSLELVRSPAGVAVVNDVALEDYVRGVAEVPASWPMEALRAQAIAARTYALNEVGRQEAGPGKDVGAHICATQACQVYVGLAQERAEGAERWAAAVESTRGQVLVKKGSPIRAMYSSGEPLPAPKPKSPPAGPAGGGGGPPPAPPPAPPDAPPAQALPIIGQPAQPPPPGAPPEPPPPQPRPKAQPDGGPRAGAAESGGVRGHGLGMSQYGALAKARRGASASTILASYYRGTRITRLPSHQLPPTIRVALEPVRSSMVVSGSERFRLLDASGRTVAVAATGKWQVVAGPRDQLRVMPPPGQRAAPDLQPLGYEPRSPPPGGELLVRFRLSIPAMVRLIVESPSGPVVASHPQLVEPGERSLALRVPHHPGRHAVSVVADAGTDRVASVPITIAVADPHSRLSASRPGASHRGSSRSALGVAGFVLWASVALVVLRRALLARWAA